jgi:hypothetical protein
LTTALTDEQIASALSEFDQWAAAPPPVFGADLGTAREMYFVAMQTEHHVARFLILYSAVLLFGVFKGRSESQATVEAILRAEDPLVPCVRVPPTAKSKRKSETVYTAARNGLVHVEGRGKNPAAASTEIARLTPAFQRLVARILSKG